MDQSNLKSSSQFSQPVRQIISLLIVAGLSGLGVIIAAPSVWPVFASNVYLNGVKMVNGTDVTVTSGTSIVFASAIGTSGTDVVDVIAFGTFQLSNFSINDANDVSTGGISDGQVLVYNSSASAFQPGNASSAEVYGFEAYYSPSTLVKTVTVQSVGGSN